MTTRRVSLIRVQLVAEQPISVASPEASGLKRVDLPVAREPFRGAPYIPTSSVVGSMREHARRSSGDSELLLRLFGGRAGDGPELRPSLIRALGTWVDAGAGDVSERTQTAVDRFRASAVTGSLRVREQLPAGTAIWLYMCLVGPGSEDLRGLKEVLKGWEPHIGGGRSVGFGRTRVKDVRHRELNLATRDGLEEWLALGGPDDWDCSDWHNWPVSGRAAQPDLRISFQVLSDLHVGTGRREGHVSLVARDGAKPVIPGSALKGVFRSRAEFILRTLGVPACASTLPVDEAESLGLKPACSADPCLACRLFGYSGRSRDEHAGRRGVVWFSDAEIETGTGRLETRTHVALDRFSGGQAHGLLFTQQVVPQGRLELQITIDDPELRSSAEALLKSVALDIHDGFVGAGHGTARGMGSLRLDESDVQEFRRLWSRTGGLRASLSEGAGT